MPTFTVQAARYGHVNRIANRMREIDRVEAAAVGHTPKSALIHGLRGSSLSWTALRDAEPVAMFGVMPLSLMDRRGSPWLLGTDAVSGSKRALLKLAPPLLRAMEGEYPRLENMVAVDNIASISWLRRLGFAFDDEIVYVRGVAFRRFHKGF